MCFNIVSFTEMHRNKKILLSLFILISVTAGTLYYKTYKKVDPVATPKPFKSIQMKHDGTATLHKTLGFPMTYRVTTTRKNSTTTAPTYSNQSLTTTDSRPSSYATLTYYKQRNSLDVVHNLSNFAISSGPGKPTHHIYSAYYDSRQLPNRPAIVMIGYISKRAHDNIFCKFMYKDNSTNCAGNLVHTPLIAPNVLPEHYFCRLSHSAKIPTSVALSAKSNCEGKLTSQIPVWNSEREETYDIGVCVQGALFTGKDLTNEMILQSLVEFLAMVKVLGAKIVTVYSASVKYEILELIVNLYPGFVDMIQWENLFGGKLHYGGQRILLNDCLYRNMKRVKYLAFIDIDEIIYPVSTDTWMEMLKILETKGKYASFTFPNNFIAEPPPNATSNHSQHSCQYMNFPKYFVRLRRLPWPSFKQHTKMKMIVKPEVLSALCIHDICKPTVGGYTTTYRVSMNIGFMAHYRVPVPRWYIYGKGVIDNTALKYRDQVMEEMERVCSIMEL